MDSKGAPVDFRGQIVWPMWSFTASSELHMRAQFTRIRPGPRKGLVLSAKDGFVVVNGQQLRKAVFWTDTAPKTVEFFLRPMQKSMTLNVWNVWEDDGHVEHAWIGNSGIVLVESDTGVVLNCSSGGGEVDFNSLVVEVDWARTPKSLP